MNPAYISAARSHLLNAVEKIAFDHFHVAKMLCAVLDKTRQSEIQPSRYLWLYGRHKRHGCIEEKLESAQMLLPDTSRCWTMKKSWAFSVINIEFIFKNYVKGRINSGDIIVPMGR